MLLALPLTACGSDDLGRAAAAAGIRPAALLRLSDDFAVAVRRRGSAVELVSFQQALNAGGWQAQVIGSHATTDEASGRLLSFGGETGLEWNSYFYGVAPETVSRVELERPDATGGQVMDGTWVVAIRAKDVAADIGWRLVDPTGRAVRVGRGVFPALE